MEGSIFLAGIIPPSQVYHAGPSIIDWCCTIQNIQLPFSDSSPFENSTRRYREDFKQRSLFKGWRRFYALEAMFHDRCKCNSYPGDIWSMGCILLELFTLGVVFNAEDDREYLIMMENVCGDKIDNSRQVCWVKNADDVDRSWYVL